MKNPSATLLFGGGAAIAGALIWAWIAAGSGYEIGWIAWAIGGVVGFAVAVSGGHGPNGAMVAALLTLLSICGGKVLAVNWYIDAELDKMISSELSQSAYQQYLREANEYVQAQSDEEIAAFMMRNEYSYASNPSEVEAEEIAYFKQNTGPELQAFHDSPASYEDWKEEQARPILQIMNAFQPSLWEKLKGSIGLIDIIFFGLGLGTAFSIVANNEVEED